MLLNKINKMFRNRVIKGYPCIELPNEFYSILEYDGKFRKLQSLKHVENLKDLKSEFKEKF